MMKTNKDSPIGGSKFIKTPGKQNSPGNKCLNQRFLNSF
jgi:hypothetical protein